MNIILGGTGHVGSAVAAALLEKQEEVLIVTRNKEKAAWWERMGASTEIVDVLNTASLHQVFLKGQRLFLLNPPGDPSKNNVEEERRTLFSILKALEGVPLRKIVAESTYGAQAGSGIGDLGVLYEMEQGLRQCGIPTSILRAAYYMTNWDASLPSMREEGKLYSFFPPDFEIPMVAPTDIAKVAASLLMNDKQGSYYVEGPVKYTVQDVAQAFASALERDVEAIAIPQEHWVSSMREIGFSDASAQAFAAMTRLTMKTDFERPAAPFKGETTILAYAEKYVAQQMDTNTHIE